MTWLAQVRHVAAKDLRQLRWTFVTYVAIVAIATIPAARLSGESSGLLGVLPFLVMAFGMVVAASLIQTDSPTRSTSFWASRPFAPSAVLASKLAVAILILIGLPMLGGLVTLRSLDIHRHIASLLINAALGYGVVLLAAFILAALARDLSTFILLSIGLFVAEILASVVLTFSALGSHAPLDGTSAHLAMLVRGAGVVGGFVLLGALYRGRRRRGVAWTGAAVAIACMSGFASIFFPALPLSGFESSEATHRAPLHVTIDTASIPSATDHMTINIGVDSATVARWLVADIAASVHTRDGATVRLAHPGMTVGPLGTSALPAIRNTRWLSQAATVYPYVSRSSDFGMTVSSEARHSLATGIVAAELSGQAIVEVAQVLGTLPLRTGATLTRGGVRVRIVTMTQARGTAAIDVATAHVSDGADVASNGIGSGAGPFSFALVNENRGEAMLLTQSGSSGNSTSLVLPGLSAYTTRVSLQTGGLRGASDPPLVDENWYYDARLVVLEWHPQESDRVRLPIVLH